MITEIKMNLNEYMFTNICKSGYFTHQSQELGRSDIHLTKVDMRKLIKGEKIEKELGDEKFIISIGHIGDELIKEIIRRSPMYSDMYYEL